MTRLRLWLARLLLPAEWIAARRENFTWLCQIASDVGVYGPDGLAEYASHYERVCTHHPTAPEPCHRCDAAAEAWWRGDNPPAS